MKSCDIFLDIFKLSNNKYLLKLRFRLFLQGQGSMYDILYICEKLN